MDCSQGTEAEEGSRARASCASASSDSRAGRSPSGAECRPREEA